MKNMVERLGEHKILCKKLTPISPKELGSRKRVSLYVGVDTQSYYCSVFVVSQKSRVLRKEAEALVALHETLVHYVDHSITKRYIWVDAPLCSKAKAWMEQAGWVFV